ncbi:MAG: zinc-dependent metalloprotease [Actinomycetota bacterium]
MPDDLFSRLFELFNQPGPINWRLAGEVAHHLAGDRQAIDPFAAEEVRELVRMVENRLEPLVPFPVAPVPEIVVVDPPQWVDLALPRLSYLAEAIGDAAAGMPIPGLGATLAGLQVGTLAGMISSRHPATFESGVALFPSGPLLIIGTGLDRVIEHTKAEPREVRLWAGASELVHRALFTVPWLIEHLGRLVAATSVAMVPDPQDLLGMMAAGSDEEGRDPSDAIRAILEHRGSSTEEKSVGAFLATSSGYRQVVVKRAIEELVPRLDRFASPPGDDPIGPVLATLTTAQMETGLAFCTEVERRYGQQALDNIWQGPERLPTADELNDPVGWAARVLLGDEIGLDR